MKKNLGRLLFILCIMQIHLYANTIASYTLKASKYTAVVKEPIKIIFLAKQEDYTDHMFFSVKPKENKNYEIHLLNKTTNDKKYHNSTTTFVYIIFPLQEGKISVNFDFYANTASDKAIAQSYVADHDDSVGIQTAEKKITVKPLELTIKPLTETVDLVGDFTLQTAINKTEVNSYDDVNIIYTLKGNGYNNKKINLLHDIKNVHIFSEISNSYMKLSEKGFAYERKFIYALSSKRDFTIPEVNLKAYSPRTHKYYKLLSKAYIIQVTPIDTTTLLDTEDAPISKHLIDFRGLQEFIIYFLVFFSGFLTAKLVQINIPWRKKENKLSNIQQTKEPKELILVLINNYKNRNIEGFITQLEDLAYNHSVKKSFTEIKKEVIDNFQ